MPGQFGKGWQPENHGWRLAKSAYCGSHIAKAATSEGYEERTSPFAQKAEQCKNARKEHSEMKNRHFSL